MKVAVIVTFCVLVTDNVVTLKLAEPELPVTVTEAGTLAAWRLELVSVTISPLAAATPFNVTVPTPTEPCPPTIVDGVTLRLCRVAGWIVSTADWLELPSVAVIVAVVVELTPVVDTLNVADADPAGTRTVLASEALALLDDRTTDTPLPCAV